MAGFEPRYARQAGHNNNDSKHTQHGTYPCSRGCTEQQQVRKRSNLECELVSGSAVVSGRRKHVAQRDTHIAHHGCVGHFRQHLTALLLQGYQHNDIQLYTQSTRLVEGRYRMRTAKVPLVTMGLSRQSRTVRAGQPAASAFSSLISFTALALMSQRTRLGRVMPVNCEGNEQQTEGLSQICPRP